MQRGHRRRWIVFAVVSAVSFGLIGGANGAQGTRRGGEPASILYFAPSGRLPGQHVSLAVTNATSAAGPVTAVISDQDGTVLLHRQVQLAPGRSAFWVPEVDDEVLVVWARVTVPSGPVAAWPATLRVDDLGIHPSVLGTHVPSRGAVSSPVLPVPDGDLLWVHVTPLGNAAATFTVRFVGPGGGSQSQQTLTGVAPRSVGTAEFDPPAAANLRAAVKGPTGLRFLVSVEVVDAETHGWICKWEGPDLDAAKN